MEMSKFTFAKKNDNFEHVGTIFNIFDKFGQVVTSSNKFEEVWTSLFKFIRDLTRFQKLLL